MWATNDGGAHWRKLSLAGGVIDSMAASAGRVYAVVAPPGGKPAELFASPAGRNAWARVRHLDGQHSGGVRPVGLVRQQHVLVGDR